MGKTLCQSFPNAARLLVRYLQAVQVLEADRRPKTLYRQSGRGA
jgi:hypothetical protein